MKIEELIAELQQIAAAHPGARAWVEFRGYTDVLTGLEWKGLDTAGVPEGVVILGTGED